LTTVDSLPIFPRPFLHTAIRLGFETASGSPIGETQSKTMSARSEIG
jgi:hypothetical protein